MFHCTGGLYLPVLLFSGVRSVEMTSEVIYSDKLVEITEDGIVFRNYYFPFGTGRVPWTEVGGATWEEPKWSNGKWRVQGTGDFRTWFPRDWKRPVRDRIFFIGFPTSRRRIGFTVEDSETVTNILSEKGLLIQK